jgi:hypothetical protein
MPRSLIRTRVLGTCLAVAVLTVRASAEGPNADFGAFVAARRVLHDRFHAAAWFGWVPTRTFERKKISTINVITKDIAAELSQNDDQLRTMPVDVVVEK